MCHYVTAKKISLCRACAVLEYIFYIETACTVRILRQYRTHRVSRLKRVLSQDVTARVNSFLVGNRLLPSVVIDPVPRLLLNPTGRFGQHQQFTLALPAT